MSKEVVKKQTEVTDQVLQKVSQFQEAGLLHLPKDYSPENALKASMLILSETMDRNKRPVLESCSKASIGNALFKMVTQGLNPAKNQCYFIAYGSTLTMSRSYLGSIAMAKRVGMKSIVANVIYEKDDFVYEIDAETGLKKLIKHETALENIELDKIKGAYTVVTMEDGTKDLEVMTKQQIINAWSQGTGYGKSDTHVKFSDEMSKKVVINRACKPIINSSSDAYLMENDESENDLAKTNTQNEINENANKEVVDFEDVDFEDIAKEEEEAVEEKATKAGDAVEMDF